MQNVDEDLKDLLTMMLSSDVSLRPDTVNEVMNHDFFIKTDESRRSKHESLKRQFLDWLQ